MKIVIVWIVAGLMTGCVGGPTLLCGIDGNSSYVEVTGAVVRTYAGLCNFANLEVQDERTTENRNAEIKTDVPQKRE